MHKSVFGTRPTSCPVKKTRTTHSPWRGVSGVSLKVRAQDEVHRLPKVWTLCYLVELKTRISVLAAF